MFIHTGFHRPTMTTIQDPLLKVYEVDNGHTWTLRFYVGDELIDYVDLERIGGTKINTGVMYLPVIREFDTSTVKEVLEHALEYYLFDITPVIPNPLDPED